MSSLTVSESYRVNALEPISELSIARLGPPFGELVKAIIKFYLTEL